MRSLHVLLAAALAALGLAGGSYAAAPRPPDRVVVHEAAWEQPTDLRGRPTGPRVQADPAAHRVGAASTASMPPAARFATLARAQATSGCRRVAVTRYATSWLFGTTLWKYTQEKYYCWSSPRITQVSVSAYACCTDPTWYFRGTIASSGWYLTWSGSSQGGHYSLRQGKFDQVVLGTTVTSVYPWTKIWVYGNGDWYYDSGV